MSPRQPLKTLVASSSQGVAHELMTARVSLEAVRETCDPHKIGLMSNGKLTAEIESPYESGKIALNKKNLEDIIHVMSFGKTADLDEGRGLHAESMAFAINIFAVTLEHAARLSKDSKSILAVAAALKDHGQVTVHRQPQKISEDVFQQNFTIRSRIDAKDIADKIARINIGEHAFYMINNSNFFSAHVMGFSFSRIDDDLVRVNLVNPVNEKVGEFIDVPLDKIEQNLEKFFTGVFFKDVCANYTPNSVSDMPTQPESGTIYTEWMKSLNPGVDLSSEYTAGKTLLQRPQKGGSCTIESVFALMATVLPRSTYKLCKAACLGTILEMGKATESLKSAEQDRIEERMKSAYLGIETELGVEKFTI